MWRETTEKNVSFSNTSPHKSPRLYVEKWRSLVNFQGCALLMMVSQKLSVQKCLKRTNETKNVWPGSLHRIRAKAQEEVGPKYKQTS